MTDEHVPEPPEREEPDEHAPAAPGHVAENHLDHVGPVHTDPEAWRRAPEEG